MIYPLQQHRIRQAFSRSACRYEQLAGLQMRLGQDLIRRIRPRPYRTMIDIGMGTGILTNELKRRWPQAHVVGVDFAPGMVKVARQNYPDLWIIQADATRPPFRPASFDLVFSNLAYQWVDDLQHTFSRTSAILRPDGRFYVNVFTRDSLKELFLALEHSRRAADPRHFTGIRRLPSPQQVMDAVRRAGLNVVEEQRQNIRVYFHNMMGLLRWLKGIGAQSAPRDFFVGKDLLAEAGEYYRTRFTEDQKIYGSFEVVTFIAKKDGEDKDYHA